MSLSVDVRCCAEINLDIIRSNYIKLRTMTDKKTKIICVVKADAYGHGAHAVAPLLEKCGADMFAVSCENEAIELRKNGIKKPIIILGKSEPSCAKLYIGYNITTTVNSYENAYKLSLMASGYGIVDVHIKVETGMGRLGLPIHDKSQLGDTVSQILKIAQLPNINIGGLFSHFATADESDDTLTPKQFELFNLLCNELLEHGLRPKLLHCSNSAALIRYPQFALDAVRPGIALYGLSPDNDSDGMASEARLTAAMTLKSRLVQVTHYDRGCTISYGGSKLGNGCDVAVVPIGYADGYPRSLSACGVALCNGKTVDVLGRVCMDMTMFNLNGIKARVGDEIVLFGKDESGNTLHAETIARTAGTINYELVCRVGARVPRKYL